MGSLVSRRTAVPVAVALASALVLVLSLVAPSPQRAAAQDSVTIDIVDFAFSGGTMSVQVGTTVTWVNQGAVNHTATGDGGSFDTGTIAPGGSASITFDTPGTYSYFCSIHPNMTGTITVVSGSSDEGPADNGTTDGGTTNGTTQMPTTGAGDPSGGSGTMLFALAAIGALVLAAGTLMLRRKTI
jgi:plastocyanin